MREQARAHGDSKSVAKEEPWGGTWASSLEDLCTDTDDQSRVIGTRFLGRAWRTTSKELQTE